MERLTPAVDCRNFTLRKLNQPEYIHFWGLLFWPVYGLRYLLLENCNPAAQYHPIHCVLDDLIPFHEGFLIFYAAWYLMIIGMHLYTMVYDPDSFRRYTRFLAISITLSTAIFLIYPSCQNLRPQVFPRDNLASRLVGLLYAVDTNTNVFPSEHAIGALAVLAAAKHTRGMNSPGKLACIGLLALLVCLSTAFLKQHSILDSLAAIPVCAIAYWICYTRPKSCRQKS